MRENQENNMRTIPTSLLDQTNLLLHFFLLLDIQCKTFDFEWFLHYNNYIAETVLFGQSGKDHQYADSSNLLHLNLLQNREA